MSLLADLTPDQRNYPATNGIDPGLLNYRRLIGFLPAAAQGQLRQMLREVQQPTRTIGQTSLDHFMTTAALAECARLRAPTLASLLSSPSIEDGAVVCSRDTLKGSKAVFDKGRVSLSFKFPTQLPRAAVLEFDTEYIVSSTTRMELRMTHSHCYIAQVLRTRRDVVALSPLVLGGPSASKSGDAKIDFDPWLYSGYMFETFPEDIDEFAAMRAVPREESSDAWHVLRDVPESRVKAAICDLLRQDARPDWGGEQSDHFSPHVHLSGRRTTAAFLLKGPSRFRPMTAAHLGKNGDQIYRLANEPADLLVVQHSHLVTEPVRATLRQFALQPYSSRRWCILDGPDTYRLLVAAGHLAR